MVNNDPPVIPPECSGLPPLVAPTGPPPRTARATAADAKAKGRRKAGDRFAVLNAFVDAGMVGLSRVELGAWLVLYRDTRDGIACTGMSSIAARVGCTRQAVVSAVNRLCKRGLLTRIVRGNAIIGPSKYRVQQTPKPPKRYDKCT